MKPEGIIFDLDGTLGDTLPLCIFSFQETSEKVTGIRPTEDQVMQYFGYAEDGISKSLYPKDWNRYYNLYLDIYKRNHSMCSEPFAGIRELLEFLKNEKYRIAMVTGKGKQAADITLEKFGIKKYFEYIETGSPKGSIKPECIKRILSNWNLSGEKVFYVGDSCSDILDSNAAGVLPVAVSWATTSDYNKLLKYNPHLIFDEIEDFKSWFLK